VLGGVEGGLERCGRVGALRVRVAAHLGAVAAGLAQQLQRLRVGLAHQLSAAACGAQRACRVGELELQFVVQHERVRVCHRVAGDDHERDERGGAVVGRSEDHLGRRELRAIAGERLLQLKRNRNCHRGHVFRHLWVRHLEHDGSLDRVC
jgi:hypothetical protein